MVSRNYYTEFCAAVGRALESVEVSLRSGEYLDKEEGLSSLCSMSKAIREEGRYQFLCGNGASASFANHMALDWTKTANVPTFSFSDSALLTAMGNDLGYEHAFSAPLSWYAKSGDLLLTISSSGNSPNILKTIEMARSKGMSVVTVSGMSSDNESRQLGDLNFFVPSNTYGVAESAHQVLLHAWLDRFLGISYSNEERNR